MDFWNGLDPGRYSQFKTDIQNGMTVGSINAEIALKNVNKVYTLAANWIKTQPVHRQGNATTYVTSYLDRVEEKMMDEETTEVFNSQEQPWSSVQAPDKNSDKKFRNNVVCHKCKQRGHYANRCPNKTVYEEDLIAVDDQVRTLNATWQASNYCTLRSEQCSQ